MCTSPSITFNKQNSLYKHGLKLCITKLKIKYYVSFQFKQFNKNIINKDDNNNTYLCTYRNIE